MSLFTLTTGKFLRADVGQVVRVAGEALLPAIESQEAHLIFFLHEE